MKPKIKICGMKHNVAEVASLQPDYLGFIFYDKSPRYWEGQIPKISSNIKKVGVFVNQEVATVVEKVKKYNLEVIQLHGEESPEYILKLYSNLDDFNPKIWKVFLVGETFNFTSIFPYEKLVDKFLFDTKGTYKGGNGTPFNWKILEEYPSSKPFILSGGIGQKNISTVKQFFETSYLPIYALDLNSQFEEEPGLKNTNALKQFIHEL